LLPLSHFKGFDYPDLIDDPNAVIGLRQLFSIFKRHYRRALALKLNPAILVDKLRPHTQRIWQNFSVVEKRQFIRRFRTRWNVARHRIAPEIHRQLQEAMANGWLEVVQGRLCACEESNGEMRVEIESRGGKRTISAGALINCTGPKENYFPSGSVLFENLVAHGLVQPDEMNMGIKAAANFSVLDAEGRSSGILFAIGSLLKGTLWETTAVPELRSQSFRVAATVAGQLAESSAGKSSISEVVEDVLEYFI
jgi:uncharacterized NAD(P)/FAD-binding protein YdhS